MATITTKETRSFDWANPGVLKVGDAMQEPNARMITWRLAKRDGYSYLTFDQRREIEALYGEGIRTVEIAAKIGRSDGATMGWGCERQ